MSFNKARKPERQMPIMLATYSHLLLLLPQADLGIHIWGGKLFRGPEGREGGWISWASGGVLRAPLAGSGAEPQPKSNLVFFSLKIWHQVTTISIIYLRTSSFCSFAQTTKLQSQKYLVRQCLPWPLIKSAYDYYYSTNTPTYTCIVVFSAFFRLSVSLSVCLSVCYIVCSLTCLVSALRANKLHI